MENAEKTRDPLTLSDGGSTTVVEPPPASVFAAPSAPLSPAAMNEESAARERVRPVFPDASAVETKIPRALSRQRPSPALDPVARARFSRLAKWLMLVAVLALIVYLPSFFANASAEAAAKAANGDDTGVGVAAVRMYFFVASALAATTLAAVIATALPRAILPGLFGRWREAVEALRDWMIVGVATGLVYSVAVLLTREAGLGPAGGVQTTADWLTYRLPLLLVASVVGILVARGVAIRSESLIARGFGSAFVQVIVQAALIGALEYPIEQGVRKFVGQPAVAPTLGWLALLLIVVAVGMVTWAYSADSALSSVRRRRGAAGVNHGGDGPVEMTLTVIGGRESGKTVLMAGAYYEWSTENFGELRVTPAPPSTVGGDGTTGIASLEDVARELYVDSHFPVGTVSTQNLPFDLSLGQEKIARFSFLDYPGGAIAGQVANDSVIRDFWERVDDTDGVIMIADMSYVRRSKRDSDWLEVRNAYRQVMQRLVDRNGKRRVVPVALVLTKCDEFIHPDTGHIDMEALNAGLKAFKYDELEEEWRQMNARNGPGFAEFSTWITSAITYSQPQRGADGRPDLSKPFLIAPAPPAITPTGCASPLLWITSKVMRWNVTLFYDISTFLFGSSPRVRQRVDSILELEHIAEQHAGRA